MLTRRLPQLALFARLGYGPKACSPSAFFFLVSPEYKPSFPSSLLQRRFPSLCTLLYLRAPEQYDTRPYVDAWEPGRPDSRPASSSPRQSALTDFLAANGISANQIRLDAETRRQAALASQGQANQDGQQAGTVSAPVMIDSSDSIQPGPSAGGRRTRASAASQQTVKQKKPEKLKASKKRKRGSDDESGGDYAEALQQRTAVKLPGQMANCELCGTRFTVTAYSQPGPTGGLLCAPCGREAAKDGPPKVKKQKRAAGPIGRRRMLQSAILDGTYRPGARNLVSLCLETLTKNISLAEDLGDMPETLVDKIARIMSKHRILDSRTIDLFLTSTTEEVHLYDGGNLTSDDIIRIFQTCPSLKHLKIRCGIQFKDEVMDYLLSRNIKLESFYLHGANLLSDEKWQEFVRKKGHALRSVRVYYTDKHFGDETLGVIKTACPHIERLKVMYNQRVSVKGVKEIAEMTSLKHLALRLQHDVHSDAFVTLINKIGANLVTLSLWCMDRLDNTVLDTIHNKCVSLRKLRITDSEAMTDDAFARFFTGWKNPGLEFLDLQKCRHVDSAKPNDNPDNIGLCSKGFRALMVHSGRNLRNLNVHACRHISEEAFEEVFAEDKMYPELVKVEISFCEKVTDFIVGCIFRSCPNVREVNVFGCMKVRAVRVPRGKILVGVPNALGMAIEGVDSDVE